MGDTVFKTVDYQLEGLIQSIAVGSIGLPDLQRPFVWKNAKVRELFDSMYKGYPVGFFLFWENGTEVDTRAIGADAKQKAPDLLVVDGQQRLTSLYAVIKGIPVVRDNYQEEVIEIAFNPTDETFEVADAAIRRNAEFIPNISTLWEADADLFEIVDGYISDLGKAREKDGKVLEQGEKARARQSLQKLMQLPKTYRFNALELTKQVDEEQVADVFVRINYEGKRLNQADFILTLMSVWWEEGRKQLEAFCRAARSPSNKGASPFNHFIEPSPDQLLRVAIGLGFRRARLKYAYLLLRGKDLETEEFSIEQRERQFEALKAAQANVLDLTNWHDFLNSLQQSGFRGSNMISSETTIIYAYVIYLLAVKEFGMKRGFELSNLIGRWFFMTALTRRYTGGSPETLMERDLADLRSIHSADELTEWIEAQIAAQFTDDYWTTSLPNQLNTSSSTSPLLFAYRASLCLLGANVLFSKKLMSDVLDPSLRSSKATAERHHLFARAYLRDLGITANREVNQVANYAFVEWQDNIGISDAAPQDYVPLYRERFSEAEWKGMMHNHALPAGWEEMAYADFLKERRKLMAAVIRSGYLRLKEGCKLEPEGAPSLAERIRGGENSLVEFKSTLRVNLHTGKNDPKMEHSALKTICAFLNSKGGTLVIGVDDAGTALGVEIDKFPNEDKMDLHLGNLIKGKIGASSALHITPGFADFEGKRVLSVECEPSPKPVYLKDNGQEYFYIRTGASTTNLPASQIADYVASRFS